MKHKKIQIFNLLRVSNFYTDVYDISSKQTVIFGDLRPEKKQKMGLTLYNRI